MFSLLAVFGLGPMELLIVGGIALLLFGSRLPTAMRSLGKGMLEFKKGVSGVDDEPTASTEPRKDDAPRS